MHQSRLKGLLKPDSWVPALEFLIPDGWVGLKIWISTRFTDEAGSADLGATLGTNALGDSDSGATARIYPPFNLGERLVLFGCFCHFYFLMHPTCVSQAS